MGASDTGVSDTPVGASDTGTSDTPVEASDTDVSDTPEAASDTSVSDTPVGASDTAVRHFSGFKCHWGLVTLVCLTPVVASDTVGAIDPGVPDIPVRSSALGVSDTPAGSNDPGVPDTPVGASDTGVSDTPVGGNAAGVPDTPVGASDPGVSDTPVVASDTGVSWVCTSISVNTWRERPGFLHLLSAWIHPLVPAFRFLGPVLHPEATSAYIGDVPESIFNNCYCSALSSTAVNSLKLIEWCLKLCISNLTIVGSDNQSGPRRKWVQDINTSCCHFQEKFICNVVDRLFSLCSAATLWQIHLASNVRKVDFLDTAILRTGAFYWQNEW